MAADDPRHDDDPDTALFWQWVGRAVQPKVGWVLAGVGGLLILIGYLGVSREALVAKQLPYLISGGIGGVTLVMLGSLFLGVDQIRRDSGRLDRLEQQMADLHTALLRRPDAPAISNGDHAVEDEALTKAVVVAQGRTYHHPDCEMVRGKDTSTVSAASARRRSLTACPMCEPELIEA